MFDFIKGNLVDLKPTYAVVDTGSIGYLVHISLNTYTKLSKAPGSKIYLHQVIREDAHILYGFFDNHERDVFRMLISVSGIGANTARLILSSLSPSEIEQAIFEGNVALLKSVKGIGIKSAQRLIVDLKDKVGKSAEAGEIFTVERNTLREESLSALVMLGFPKSSVQKVLDQILQQEKELSVEEVIKAALKRL